MRYHSGCICCEQILRKNIMARLFRNLIGSVTGKVFASLSIVFLFVTAASSYYAVFQTNDKAV
jgi:hypothetical protein